jgi:2-polyprenyl-3-methyl-5-hydroxy-6-metoxy-1,4-benzoquinol methylase
LNEPTELPDGCCDLVVSAEVIEHLENPRATMREWHRLLKPGGWVVLSTPNNESWRSLVSLLLRGHFAGFCGRSYPAHITALLRLDIERAAAEAGFANVAFRYSDHGYFPKFVNFTWQGLSGGVLKGRMHSDNLIALLQKPGR